MFLIWVRTGFICKNYEFNQRKCVLLALVSSKQEHRLHRPTYFVSDITHSPLNGLFSSTRPIALNYRASWRLRRYSRAKLEWYWYISLCIVHRIDSCPVKLEGFAFLSNHSNSTIFHQCIVSLNVLWNFRIGWIHCVYDMALSIRSSQ